MRTNPKIPVEIDFFHVFLFQIDLKSRIIKILDKIFWVNITYS